MLRLDDAPFGEFDMGPTVVFDVGPVTLLISTHRGVAGNVTVKVVDGKGTVEIVGFNRSLAKPPGS